MRKKVFFISFHSTAVRKHRNNNAENNKNKAFVKEKEKKGRKFGKHN